MSREEHERRAFWQVGFAAVFIIGVGTAGVVALDSLIRMAL